MSSKHVLTRFPDGRRRLIPTFLVRIPKRFHIPLPSRCGQAGIQWFEYSTKWHPEKWQQRETRRPYLLGWGVSEWRSSNLCCLAKLNEFREEKTGHTKCLLRAKGGGTSASTGVGSSWKQLLSASFGIKSACSTRNWCHFDMHTVSVYAINLVKKLTKVIGMNLKFVQHVVNKSRFLKLISFMIKQFRRNTRKTMQNSTPTMLWLGGSFWRSLQKNMIFTVW